MENTKLDILFISSWYPHKSRPLDGIFIQRHAAANTIDCSVSAIFICSGEGNSIEKSVEDGIYTIRGYYKAPRLNSLFFLPIKIIRHILTWRKVLAIYKREKGKPGIINSNIVFPVSIIARFIKMMWGVPYVITEHWTGYFPENGSYKGFIQKTIARIAVSSAGAVITDSAKLGRTMLALGLKNKYFAIPNVVDINIFKAKQQLWRKPEDYFNFIHISSLLDVHKNINGIIRTFKKFRTIHPLSKLTIIWDEENRAVLDKLTEPFSEDAGVFLTGKKDQVEITDYLQKADAFILFSNYENLPCVMLESFCCGVPVIGTRVGDVPEYINEKNGILIDSGNEEQLLEAMEKIYRNSSDYSPIEIRNMVVDKVSPAAISRQFTDIYKSVLQSRKSQ